MTVPVGEYALWADDDDVIGTTVAHTYPQHWPIVCATAGIEAFDEFLLGRYLAWCLTNAPAICAVMGVELEALS